MGINSHPSPRVDNVREYLKALQRRDAQREKEQFADKGRDTLLDGYTEDANQGWDKDYNFGTRDAAVLRWKAEIRAHVDFISTDHYEELASLIHETK